MFEHRCYLIIQAELAMPAESVSCENTPMGMIPFNPLLLFLVLPLPVVFPLAAFAAEAVAKLEFEAITLDSALQIGYGVDISDVDGDGWPDILLADKRRFVWYRNPGQEWSAESQWKKHLLAENLTEHDNVCIAARDIDGDGRCEIAVGGDWNPGDTVDSGAVFYLVAPADRTQPWEPVRLHAEPTVHRMRWIQLPEDDDAKWGLMVAPLHGRGNKDGEGAPARLLLYKPPAGDPRGSWKTELISESFHMTHNFHVWEGRSALVLSGREGLMFCSPEEPRGWANSWLLGDNEDFPVGEISVGRLHGKNNEFWATIEPMHGNRLVIYRFDNSPSFKAWFDLTDQLVEGHALACGDLLGAGTDQLVVGWRGNPKNPAAIGVHLWVPRDADGMQWTDMPIDDGGMACEDLKLGDLNGDGRLDIVAAGRSTKNLKIYLNRSGK